MPNYAVNCTTESAIYVMELTVTQYIHSMLADIYPQYQMEPVQWTVPPDGRICHCNS